MDIFLKNLNLSVSDRFFPPSDENKEKLRHTFNHDSHGHSGSVRTTFPGLTSGVDIPFLDVSAEISSVSAVFDTSKTLEALGIHVAKDPVGNFHICSINVFLTACLFKCSWEAM